MATQSDSDRQTTDAVSPAQRRSVLRMAGAAVSMALTLPLYYGLLDVAPAVAAVVPEILVHALFFLGLCVVFPLTLAYASRVGVDVAGGGSADPPDYGVGDRWERRNL